MTMASQTVSTRPQWADMPIRVDPACADRRQSFEMMDDGERVGYRVDRRGVVINRILERSGVPMSIALPARAFEGVAARVMSLPMGADLSAADQRAVVEALAASTS